MDPVNTPLLNAVGALLLAETRGIAGQCLRQLLLGGDGVNKFTDHGMFTGADQIQVLSLYLVHHGIHLRKTHHACDNIAADHERRHTVGKAAVDHEIPGIGDHRGVQPCNVTHEIIEPITGHPSCSVQIDSVKALHDLRMVRDLKIRNHRLAKTLHLHVLTVILANGNAGIYDIGDRHHDL